ncbi:MAG: glucosyl transferase [Leptolyngbya sp.]|nr:MAG: glucosyl transferase [Leptolyngbya sp.]
MSNAPLVSILINNYNYGCYLKQAIDSALAQTYGHIEIIVVDDGSQDNSVEVINSYPQPAITTVFKPNGGQASAFNAGLAVAAGDLICFLDADDYFYADKVQRIVELFQQHPHLGWIFHKLNYVDTQGNLLEIADPSKDITQSEVVDFRQVLATGRRFTQTIPCGLCFRHDLLGQILPMPEARGVTISDNYIKYAALSLAPGLFLPHRLAAQRIHDSNTYTFRTDNQVLRAEINIKTGFYLQQNFPGLRRFADKLFARGCGEMFAQGASSTLRDLPEFRLYLQRYSSPAMVLKTIPKTVFHALRFKAKGLGF